MDRENWIMVDQYERAKPSYYGPMFYDAIGWLYPDDPWVVSAVRAYRARTPRAAPIEVARVKQSLATALRNTDNPPKIGARNTVVPWLVAAAIHQLLADDMLHEARDIANKSLELAIAQQVAGEENFAYRLRRRVEQAEAQDAK